MSAQGRLGDKAQVPLDAHGCPACPHPAIGPAIAGSPTVNVNKRPALRVDDPGMHAACCGPNTWTATKGAATVFYDGKAAHRMGDQNRHCGGTGQLIEGSPNVMVGDSGGGGGAGGGAAGGRAGGGGGGGAAGGGGAGGGGGGAGGGGGGAGGGPDAANGGGTARSDTSAGADTPDTPIEPDQIEVRLVDSAGNPTKAISYRLVMPDGTEQSGTTDGGGVLKLTGLTQRGDCRFVLPDIDDLRGKSS